MQSTKISVPELQRLKASGQKITALTAYDYPFARILDECGIDFLLVGDSLGTTVQGGGYDPAGHDGRYGLPPQAGQSSPPACPHCGGHAVFVLPGWYL